VRAAGVRARKSRISAAIAGRLESDAWLVVSRSATDVDDPAVRERDDRRLAGENDLAAEDIAVEAAGAFDILGDDEVRKRDSVGQRRKACHGRRPPC
jgi:hypothetical protein